MEVCTLSGWDKSGIPIRAITARLSLSPPSYTRSSDGFPCGSLAAFRFFERLAEGRAYHVPCDTDAASNTATSRLGSVSPPVVQRRRIPIAYGNSQPHTVLVKANSSLGLSLFTRVQSTIHIVLPMRQSPSPLTALLLAVSIGFTRANPIPPKRGYIVYKASHPAVAGDACLSW